MVRVMAYRLVGALVASVSFVALAGLAEQAFARSGGAPAFAGAAHARPAVTPTPIARAPFRHHRRAGFGGFWPTVGGYGYYDGTPYGTPAIDVTQPSNVHYTYTYDVPWDWAHRFPPNVVPSDRPYAQSCTTEPVTVPGRSGDHVVNVTRCY
jgi:hypothetical protein